jgi:hypothetical protein
MPGEHLYTGTVTCSIAGRGFARVHGTAVLSQHGTVLGRAMIRTQRRNDGCTKWEWVFCEWAICSLPLQQHPLKVIWPGQSFRKTFGPHRRRDFLWVIGEWQCSERSQPEYFKVRAANRVGKRNKAKRTLSTLRDLIATRAVPAARGVFVPKQTAQKVSVS